MLTLNCSILVGKKFWLIPATFDNLADFAAWACKTFNDGETVQAYEGDQLIAFVDVLDSDRCEITEVTH